MRNDGNAIDRAEGMVADQKLSVKNQSMAYWRKAQCGSTLRSRFYSAYFQRISLPKRSGFRTDGRRITDDRRYF
jgi:hypothetical protein